MTKDKILQDNLSKDYFDMHCSICHIKGCMELLKEVVGKKNNLLSDMSYGKDELVLKLEIGEILYNFEMIYKVAISTYDEEGNLEDLICKYVDKPAKHIDYELFNEAPGARELKGYNPYKDLIELEQYILDIMNLSNDYKTKFIKLYDELNTYNNFSIFERRDKLNHFCMENLEHLKSSNEYLEEYLEAFRCFTSFDEEFENIQEELLRNIDKIKMSSKKLIIHDGAWYFKVVNIMNKIKSDLEVGQDLSFDIISEDLKSLETEIIPQTYEIIKKINY